MEDLTQLTELALLTMQYDLQVKIMADQKLLAEIASELKKRIEACKNKS